MKPGGSSQFQPTAQPAWRSKKATAKRIYQSTYTVQRCLYKVQWCLYILLNVCSLTQTLDIQLCTLYVHVYMIQNVYINV
jgi:hypothetical protein